MSKPVIEYWPLRGRAEAARLVLAYKGIDWEEKSTDWATMKADRASFPFGQCPRYSDGHVALVQSSAILRYLGRKYELQGTTEQDVCQVDMLLEGIESLRVKYLALVYSDRLAEEAKAKYWDTHGDKANATARCGGAHLEYLATFVRNNPAGLTTGSNITVADLALFDIVDLHNRIFPEQLKQAYPELVAFHTMIEAIEGVKAYRSSPRCNAKINGNDLG